MTPNTPTNADGSPRVVLHAVVGRPRCAQCGCIRAWDDQDGAICNDCDRANMADEDEELADEPNAEECMHCGTIQERGSIPTLTCKRCHNPTMPVTL